MNNTNDNKDWDKVWTTTKTEEEWKECKLKNKIGDIIEAIVAYHQVYGIFLVIDGNTKGLIERICMENDGYNTPEEYPPIGKTISARVLGYRDDCQEIEVRLLPVKKGNEFI